MKSTSLHLYNTQSRSLKEFTCDGNTVRLYTCGPTVYDYLHIGNWAAYIFWDTLVRVLEGEGHQVERVLNITDVGHLVSDDDEGEDKLEKGARREGKTAWEVAEFYTEDFLENAKKLGLIMPDHIARATDYIEEQLQLVRRLKAKGYTYQITDGIYFDSTKFPRYGDFARLNIEELKAGARVEFDPEKRSVSDFALWKFTPKEVDRDMEWDTPSDLLDSETSQRGFPGWHLECSAIAMKHFGDTLDIHTGGIDHIPVHHTNEIAQSEAVTGKQFSRFWLHNNHMKVDGSKISKSLGNGFMLSDLEAKGFNPFDFRLLVLQSHYQSESNFTFESLEAAKNRRHHWKNVACLRWQIKPGSEENTVLTDTVLSEVTDLSSALLDNLNTPKALQIADKLLSTIENSFASDVTSGSIHVTVMETLDKLFGVDLVASTPDINEKTKQLLNSRQAARDTKDWELSDKLRSNLLALGVEVKDTASGSVWSYL